MSFHRVFTFCFVLTAFTNLSAAPANLVWIIADDMSPDIAVYGTVGVRTPHLDQMAQDGRRYTRAYATAPVCSSSRSALILGTYQITTGLHAHDVENPQPLAAPYRPLPHLFREAGWFVTNAPAPGSERSGKTVKKAKTHYNFAHDAATMYDGDDWQKRAPGQRFFAQFQITEPHRPFPIPEMVDEDLEKALVLPSNYPEHPLVRRDWYAYLRSVEVVDQRVGAILDQLREAGVLDDTLVIFSADHGRPMPWGKQWLGVEGLQVPLIVRGPGIVPGSVESGLVSLIDLAPSALMQAAAEIPSWMEGQPIFGQGFPERDRIFAARDRCGDAADRIRAVIGRDSLMVENFFPDVPRWNWSGYKEASYPGLPLLRSLHETGQLSESIDNWLQGERSPLEYYDLRTDPLSIRDLSSEAQVQTALAAERYLLDAWIASTGDTGVLPDPPTEPTFEEIRKDKRSHYQRTWQKRLGKDEPSDAERVTWWEAAYGLNHGPKKRQRQQTPNQNLNDDRSDAEHISDDEAVLAKVPDNSEIGNHIQHEGCADAK